MILQSQYEFDPNKDLIGQGGFSTVYKAVDTKFNMNVAIKRFVRKDSSSKGSVINEINKCIQLSHPNIIRYYNCFKDKYSNEFGQTQEVEYGVMEYANSGDFGQILSGEIKVSDDEFKDIIKGILEGLKYLHSRSPSIIHRDLKPANILLTKENSKLIPKICDFGISKMLSTDTRTTTTTGYLGSIEYMSPEQLNMQKFGVDGRLQTNTDLWALGCMLYEYFVGESPFGKRSQKTGPEIIYSKIIEKEPIHGYKSINEPYLTFIQRCLVKKAKHRVQDENELIELILNSIEVKNSRKANWPFFLTVFIEAFIFKQYLLNEFLTETSEELRLSFLEGVFITPKARLIGLLVFTSIAIFLSFLVKLLLDRKFKNRLVLNMVMVGVFNLILVCIVVFLTILDEFLPWF